MYLCSYCHESFAGLLSFKIHRPGKNCIEMDKFADIGLISKVKIFASMQQHKRNIIYCYWTVESPQVINAPKIPKHFANTKRVGRRRVTV